MDQSEQANSEPVVVQFAGRIVGVRWVYYDEQKHRGTRPIVNMMVLEQGKMMVKMQGSAIIGHEVEWEPVTLEVND